MSHHSMLHISMEQVDFQRSKLFFNELTVAIGVLRKMPKRTSTALTESNIPTIIKHHTGLLFDTIFDTSKAVNAAVFPPYVDADSPLLASVHSGIAVDDTLRPGMDVNSGQFYGEINLENGKVTGIFSKLISKLWISEGMLKLCSDEEVAGAILHEVGHIFCYFEYIVRSVRTGVLIQQCAKALQGIEDKTIRVKIIRDAADSIGSDVNADALANSSKDEVIVTVLMRSVITSTYSSIKADFYDWRTWEAIADQYATRQGAGRYLPLALDKMYRSQSLITGSTNRDQVAFVAMEAVKVITLALFASSVVLMPAVILTILMRLVLPNPKEGVYDRPGERIDRIRNDLVNGLKNPMLDNHERDSIHQDIAVLDGLRERTKDRNTFFQLIWKNLTKYRRDNYHQIEFQQELEKLANTDLFITSSKLKTLFS